jgi:23S rRNA (guanine1835-N2)-methyltransferase
VAVAHVAETTLDVPQGTVHLRRWPRVEQDALRAWDAADAYLLQHLAEEPPRDPVWVVNDGCGALTTVLASAGHTVWSSSDSYLARKAMRANLTDNDVRAEAVSLLTSLDDPPGRAGTLLVKVPRSLALLEDQLHRARAALAGDARVVGAGMVRDIHTSTLQHFETILGPTTTSLARRKARLIHTRLDAASAPAASPGLSEWEHAGLALCSHAGVFSKGRLDNGTRHLLDHVGSEAAAHIVDLGCGSGIVGLVAAQRNPTARLTFVDESDRAVASARENWRRHGGEREATFHAADGLDPVADDSVDLVLCNPPFHESRAVGDAVAWRMFTGARRVLRRGGELRIVGNRHLAYHAKLRRLFGRADVLASDPKYVVLRARR